MTRRRALGALVSLAVLIAVLLMLRGALREHASAAVLHEPLAVAAARWPRPPKSQSPFMIVSPHH